MGEIKIDAKAMLKRLAEAKKDDRKKLSLYLSKSLYEAFKGACGAVPASVVMEELMRTFVDGIETGGGRKK